MEYVKLPKKIFYVKDEVSILKQIGNIKVLLVLDYLYVNTNRAGIIKFTLENMVTECGYIPSTKKGETNAQFKDILFKLIDTKVISCNVDLVKLKPKDLIIISSLNLDYDSNYIMLFLQEKEKILTQIIDKVDNLKLLIYYCYLKARIYKRSKGEDDLVSDGGRAEVAFPSYKIINDDLGLTDETIKKYNDILVKLNLIRIGSAGNWYYKDDTNKVLRESCNIYTLYSTDAEYVKLNLEQGIKYYKSLEINSNKIFTDSKEYKNNNRKLNGQLGAIIKKEKLGTVTQEDLKRKNEILDSINVDSEMFKIKALLDNNKDLALYDIYASIICNEDMAEKYWDLETKLGLIDEIGNMTVDRDYYIWALTNVNKFGEDYMANCVAEHKRESEHVTFKSTYIGNPNPFDDIKDFGWDEM